MEDEIYEYLLNLTVADGFQLMIFIVGMAIVTMSILYITVYAIKHAVMFFKDITKP